MRKRKKQIESNELSPTALSNGAVAPSSPPRGESEPLRTILLDEDQFRAFLKSLSEKHGGFVEAGAKLGVSGQFLGAVVRGREKPGKTILERLGVKARRFYEVEVETQ